MTRHEPPVLVTTARQSPRDELRARERRYLVTMGVRVVCFVGAILLAVGGFPWLAGAAIVASLVLPWVAVIAANAGPRRRVESPALYNRQRRELDGEADPQPPPTKR